MAQGRGCLLAAAPLSPLAPGVSGTILCLSVPLTTRERLTLQLGFSEGAASAVDDWDRLARLSAPLLMWARQACEYEALERLTTKREERWRREILRSLKAQEDEREWLALELHDRIAQILATVFQYLQSVESLARDTTEIREQAVRASVLCREAIRETRNIMKDLQPPVLDGDGLLPLLEEESQRFEQEAGISVKVGLTHTVPPPRDVAVVVYRIFHEALINIRRHAQASEVTVILRCEEDEVGLQVEDNGAGFDVAATVAEQRVGGLMSMQRRAEMAQGKVRIESKPGQGTRITARIPWPKRRHGDRVAAVRMRVA